MSTVTFKGGACNLGGTALKVGDAAPKVTLVNAKDLADKVVGGASNGVQLIISVPSLDTPVCATETRRFHQEAARLEGIEVTVVSMDLPFAASRFCSAEGIDKLTVASDFRNKAFAAAYGVLLADGPLAGLTARAIFVVKKNGTLAYKQIVPEITSEPVYAAALAAAKDAAFSGSKCCGSCA